MSLGHTDQDAIDEEQRRRTGRGTSLDMLLGGGGALTTTHAAPILYQTEGGLSTREDRPYTEGIRQYHEVQRATGQRTAGGGGRRQFDFSQLPHGADGATEGLRRFLGREPTTTEVSNASAFLDTLAFAEGTAQIGYRADGGKGYNVQVGGGIINDLTHHPGQAIRINAYGLYSTAFGRYQMLRGTEDEAARATGLRDMSAASQDIKALYLMTRNGSLRDVISGNFEAAVHRNGGIWASLPNNNYGQRQLTVAALTNAYMAAGGVFTGQTAVARATQPGAPAPGAGTTPPTTTAFLAIGDSIANAAINGGADGTKADDPSALTSTAAGSRSPQHVLNYLNSLPSSALAGRNILLSSGASNNTSQVALLQDQILRARALGAASVTVLGVGPRADYQRLDINGELGRIAAANGAAFAGPLQRTASDEVHPADGAAQVELVTSARQALAALPLAQAPATQAVAATAPVGSAGARLRAHLAALLGLNHAPAPSAPTTPAPDTPRTARNSDVGQLRTAAAKDVPTQPTADAGTDSRPQVKVQAEKPQPVAT